MIFDIVLKKIEYIKYKIKIEKLEAEKIIIKTRGNAAISMKKVKIFKLSLL